MKTQIRVIKMSKNCSICKIKKPATYFNKRSSAKDGMRPECRSCQCLHNLEVRRSKLGWVAEILHTQKRNSTKRGMAQPDYTLDELVEWVMPQELFHKLHETWKISGYKQNLRPSIDRVDDYLPYTSSNIQLMTWEENCKKAGKDVKTGTNRKPLKAVVQLSLKGEKIKEYYSISEASRMLNIKNSGIVNCLKGRLKTSGGFKWEYL
jgi:hypothetical protein